MGGSSGRAQRNAGAPSNTEVKELSGFKQTEDEGKHMVDGKSLHGSRTSSSAQQDPPIEETGSTPDGTRRQSARDVTPTGEAAFVVAVPDSTTSPIKGTETTSLVDDIFNYEESVDAGISVEVQSAEESPLAMDGLYTKSEATREVYVSDGPPDNTTAPAAEDSTLTGGQAGG